MTLRVVVGGMRGTFIQRKGTLSVSVCARRIVYTVYFSYFFITFLFYFFTPLVLVTEQILNLARRP